MVYGYLDPTKRDPGMCPPRTRKSEKDSKKKKLRPRKQKK